jgi:hypothetical protein
MLALLGNALGDERFRHQSIGAERWRDATINRINPQRLPSDAE